MNGKAALRSLKLESSMLSLRFLFLTKRSLSKLDFVQRGIKETETDNNTHEFTRILPAMSVVNSSGMGRMVLGVCGGQLWTVRRAEGSCDAEAAAAAAAAVLVVPRYTEVDVLIMTDHTHFCCSTPTLTFICVCVCIYMYFWLLLGSWCFNGASGLYRLLKSTLYLIDYR